MTEATTCEPWDAPPRQVGDAAVGLVSACLGSDIAKMHEMLACALQLGQRPAVYAALNLSRALVVRLVGLDAMGLVDGALAEITEDPESDQERQLGARLLLAHALFAPAPPIDNGDMMLHNLGVEQFNAVIDEAAHEFGHVLVGALRLWGDLLDGKGADELDSVAAELWPSQPNTGKDNHSGDN